MPETIQALTLAILFIVPGYILGSVYNRNLTLPGPTDILFVVRAIIFSIVNHLIASPWTNVIYSYWIQGNDTLARHWTEFASWTLITIIILPIVLGMIFSRVIEAPQLQPLLEHVGYSVSRRSITCWDFYAQKPFGAWVIIGFKDGEFVAGKFGKLSRIATTLSDGSIPRDIYLEEAWISRDGNTFRSKIRASRGIWVDGSEIRWIKFFS